ncbi:putative Sensor histidine kinase [Candidatus Filomicrobium marinum]|uniref:histidine kinase n=1 Tax=Candidatus Filomicrobium marinum TaxID=1608628 RepID=A0A0D6JEX6_9HYPH|nr:ATP-binding protein [Candidatus Filomicrobium marinum]CFX23709.1 putative Sensor histidine kinase [Candidatus Filomicrobium marinum]CPR19081.1 putative Sensor histidine kinase [Candidatus Filomicrobium marinum]
MIRNLDTLRGRAFILIFALLLASNAAALVLYSYRHNDAMDALHDAMFAEQVAIVVQLMDRLPPSHRPEVATALTGTMLGVSTENIEPLPTPKEEHARAGRITRLINSFLDRPPSDPIGVRFGESDNDDLKNSAPVFPARLKLVTEEPIERVLQNVYFQGNIKVATELSDGTGVLMTGRLLAVPHFSWAQMSPSLLALTSSALVIAFWLLGRFIAPLVLLEGAARRLAEDINSPALRETGPLEVRSATAAFNGLQTRIKQLISDRSATAAAIAHDLGTPVTRLRLRAHEIEDTDVRDHILSDLNQMQRMIAGALDFTRLDFDSEKAQKVDLVTLVESVSSDLTDMGRLVDFRAEGRIILTTKPTLLRRAIVNVAQNASSYGKQANISLLTKDRDVTIAIHDDGPGMSPAEWDEAVKPFRRLQKNSDAIYGSGLGLTIARRIMEELGGRIEPVRDQRGRFGVAIQVPRGEQQIIK